MTKAALPYKLLPPGTYRVEVTKQGYQQAQPALVRVPVTESIRVSIAMKVSGITQTIEVQADTSPLQGETIAL